MTEGDLIIFINDHGDTASYIRGDNGVWVGKVDGGLPTDEDIKNIKDAGRLFIQIRNGFIVETNLTAVRKSR